MMPTLQLCSCAVKRWHYCINDHKKVGFEANSKVTLIHCPTNCFGLKALCDIRSVYTEYSL